MLDAEGFLWEVPETGFKWGAVSQTPGVEPNCYLVYDERAPRRRYHPMKEPGLYRNFAALPVDNVPASRERALEFVNLFGRLSDPGMAEHWWFWMRAIHEMREMIFLWEKLQEQDVDGLSKLIRWQTLEANEKSPFKGAGWVYDRKYDGKLLFATVPPPDQKRAVLAAAASLLEQWINSCLRPTIARLSLLPDQRNWTLRFVPYDLYTALWLQFAHAVAKGKGRADYRACKQCGKWFEFSDAMEDRRTVRREFCSDPCKSRDYRRRKERAQQLRTEGKPVQAIAKEIGTDIDTVKKWVGSKRKGKRDGK